MGRAKGSVSALRTSAPGSRRATGIAQSNPIEGTDATSRVKRIVDDVHRGNFDLALAALGHHRKNLNAPLVAEVLHAVSETSAASVRPATEAALVEGLTRGGFDAARTAEDRVRLRDELAVSIETGVRQRLSSGERVGREDLDTIAAGASRTAVAEALRSRQLFGR